MASAVGLAVIVSGVVFAAALSRGAVGYVAWFPDWPFWLMTVIVVGVLGILAAWGISESVTVVSLLTLIELGALIQVIMARRVVHGMGV